LPPPHFPGIAPHNPLPVAALRRFAARGSIALGPRTPIVCALQKIKLSTDLIYLLQYILSSCTSERAMAIAGVQAKTNGLLLGP